MGHIDQRVAVVLGAVFVSLSLALIVPHELRADVSPTGGESSAPSAANRVEAALGRLKGWLGTSAHGRGWHDYLRTDQLEAQLAAGRKADRQIVRNILIRYSGERPGLEHRRFQDVRQSLRAWLAELPASLETLPEEAREAKQQFEPITPQHVSRARQRLAAALDRLERFLRSGGRDKLAGWQNYLQWSQLQSELQQEERPDLSALNEVLNRFYENRQGLERPEFQQARQALRNYMNAVLFASSDDVQQAYAQQLDELAGHLEQYAAEPNREDAMAIGRILGWLRRADQAEPLVAAVERQFDQPNFYARLSSRLVDAGFRDEVDETVPVEDTILGTYVRGTATTRGDLRVHLVPSEPYAMVDIRLTGAAYSDNVGWNGPVTIYSNGVSRILAAKRLVINSQGLHAGPAVADVETNTTINGIAAKSHLVETIAWRRARDSKPQAEQIASRKAEGRVTARMDAQAAEMLSEANSKFYDKFRNPLLRRDGFPRLLKFRTTGEHLFVRALQANRFQLGAGGEPPALDGDFDLAVRMHESTVGNTSESLLAGITLSDERLQELMEELTGEVPDELKIGPDKDPWSITFAGEQPVSARFEDGQLSLAIRGRRFTRGDQDINATVEISANYGLERAEGGAKLTRQGDVEVNFVNRRSLSVSQIAFKTFLQRKFEALFKPEIVGSGFTLPGRWARAGKMQLREMNANDGWLALAWQAEGESRLTARTQSAKLISSPASDSASLIRKESK